MTTSVKKSIWRIAGIVVLLLSICTLTVGSPASAESNRQPHRTACDRFTIEAELVKEGPVWENPYRGEAIFSYSDGRTETTQVTIYPGSPTPLPQSDGTQLAAQTNYYVFEDGSSIVGQNTAVVTTESPATAGIEATVDLVGGTRSFENVRGRIRVDGNITFSELYPWGALEIDAKGYHCTRR